MDVCAKCKPRLFRRLFSGFGVRSPYKRCPKTTPYHVVCRRKDAGYRVQRWKERHWLQATAVTTEGGCSKALSGRIKGTSGLGEARKKYGRKSKRDHQRQYRPGCNGDLKGVVPPGMLGWDKGGKVPFNSESKKSGPNRTCM